MRLARSTRPNGRAGRARSSGSGGAHEQYQDPEEGPRVNREVKRKKGDDRGKRKVSSECDRQRL